MTRMRKKRASYPRRTYRAKRSAFVRHNWGALSVVLAALGVILGIEAIFMSGYVLGLTQGLLVAVFGGLMFTVFHLQTGSIWQLAGAWGEDNTRDVLAKARRRRLIWGWADNVETQTGDIDHLVVMRDGRLLALDSKWHTASLKPATLSDDARKATDAARRASLVLRSLHLPHIVTPVVVVWGNGGPKGVPTGARVDGVEFVAGRGLLELLRRDDGAQVDKADAKALLDAIHGFKDRVRPSSSAR